MLSTLLVGAQFVLLGALAALALIADWGLASVLAALAGTALGIWTLRANPPGNFNVRPQPRAGARLITHGPYRWVRHPMYSAVLLVGSAPALGAPAGWLMAGWLAWIALVVVLFAKALVEEDRLARIAPEYSEYQRTTCCVFIPWVL